MINWYSQIVSNITKIPDFISYYELELEKARKSEYIKGSVMRQISDLPGLTEMYFSQLQEIEAVLNFLNIQSRKLHRKYFQKYLENYNKSLSSRDVEKYVDGEDEVIEFDILINDVALLRNKYLALIKGLDSKQWMIGNAVKLKVAGLEEFSI